MTASTFSTRAGRSSGLAAASRSRSALLWICTRATLIRLVMQPTNLYPLRKAVEEENEREFRKLQEQSYEFTALDDSRGEYAATVKEKRLQDAPPAKNLRLKKGAQVLLLANLDVQGA